MAELKYEIEDINDIASKMVNEFRDIPVWLFEGDMGAGKTTLIAAVCKVLGVVSPTQSPTFSIVNEYITENNEVVYHFDCYRLKNEMEAYDIGIEEYLDSGHYCFIEWPDRIASLLPETFVRLQIKKNTTNSRTIFTTYQ